MHLMTFMELKKPGPIFKYAVVTTQFFFTMGFSFAYLISPNFCHRYVVLHFIWQGKRFNSGNGNKNLKKIQAKKLVKCQFDGIFLKQFLRVKYYFFMGNFYFLKKDWTGFSLDFPCHLTHVFWQISTTFSTTLFGLN